MIYGYISLNDDTDISKIEKLYIENDVETIIKEKENCYDKFNALKLVENDSLVIYRLEFLGKNIKSLLVYANNLRKKQVSLIILTGEITHNQLCFLHEVEKNILAKQVKFHLKENDKKRKPRVDSKIVQKALEMYYNNIPIEEITKQYKISRTSIYRYVNRDMLNDTE